MSWREREGLRREVLRYTLPDRPSVTPFIPVPTDPDPRKFEDEWKTNRQAVQPKAVFGSMDPLSWPFAPDAIDEESAGTYYTDWIDFENGPKARGIFSCPESALGMDPEEESGSVTANVYLELYDKDGGTTSIHVVNLTTDANATRTGSGLVFFTLTSGKQITKGRYKVVAGAAVTFTSSGSIVSYGSL